MNKQETDKLIADFMELNINNRNPNTILYCSDWNWLMEVITKITTLTEFNSYPNDTDFWDAYNSIDKQATYNACIKFIKWFNEQK
jgi:hypothetical protein